MKWKLGDFVRFVDEKREGYVTRIFDDQMIGVTGDDDFEIPVLATKVTSVYGHGAAANNNDDSAASIVPAAAFVQHGVYLAVVSDSRAASVVHFHLVNETSFELLATLTTQQQEKYKGEFSGIIAPHSTVDMYAAQLADIQLWPVFDLQALFYTKQQVKPGKPITFSEKFKAKDFAGTKKTVPILKQAGWLFRLDEAELVIDAQKLKESFFKPAEEKQELDKPQHDIDLHIEKLRDDYQFLDSSEILQIQLNHFRKMLDAAIVHQMPSIVFIHGAGNGILRHEIHKLLGRNQKVQTFMDAQKEKFGFGATRVMLK
ncbi:Smr/MutS family protein [Mucilaginibacter agri]|uniref:DNA mismatch repair protein MutS n=1 Tax=Mucilaginibacter agri TaxID=2695265 RepID=A0A965ZHH8_9SPHI|nr:Smr/MutS family protein [Mucilaginibacter agri]NCD71193.1 DNA mismatch repair protein MutS [Mucilaginibacter agri]